MTVSIIDKQTKKWLTGNVMGVVVLLLYVQQHTTLSVVSHVASAAEILKVTSIASNAWKLFFLYKFE